MRKERKKMESQRKQQGEMMDDQTANHAAKPLKTGKEKKNHQFWNSRISLSCPGVTPLASSIVCLCLLDRFGALLWQAAGSWGPSGLLDQRPGRVASCRLAMQGPR
jgi:hypothetical protein